MTAVKPRLVNLPAGLRSAQPAASAVAVGALYFVTDEGVVERNNGTTWDSYSGVPEDISLNSLTFVGTTVPATPAVGSAVIFGASAGGHTAPSWMDEQGFVVRLTRDLLLLVRNTSGSTITRGQACRFTGSTGVTPTIGLADADVFDSGRPRAAVGLAIETMANNAYGAIILSGLISDLNTSGFVEGSTVYLSTTAGTLTGTAPSSAGCFVQPCGQVTRSHATTGSLELDFEVPATTLLQNLTVGRVPFVGTGPVLVDDSTFLFDSATDILTTGNHIIQGSASPGVRMVDTDEAADAKRFRLVVAGAAVYLQAVDDAESTATATLSMGRTGIVTNAGQPTAYVTKSGAQTLTHNTPAAVTFDTESYDVGNAHDNSTNNHRLTVPTGAGGTYMIVGNVSYVANSAGLRAAALIKNGATVLASVVINAVVGDGTAMQAVAVAQLAAADYVHLSVLQTSGGNLDASVSGTFLQWVKIW